MHRTELTPQVSATSGPAPAASAADARLRHAGTPVADAHDGIDASRAAPIVVATTPLSSGAASAKLLASLDALLSTAGAIQGQIGELGDVDFAIGRVRAHLGFRYPLTERHHQGLSRTASAAAAFAGGHVPRSTAATQAFSHTVAGMAGSGFQLGSNDVQALVQWVLREAYLEGTQDLRYYAEKVKFFNMQKKAIREQLATWRKLQTEFAGLTEEEKGNTNLDGSTKPGSGAGGESTVDGGAPIVTSAAQRARDYPEGNILVAEFLSFHLGSGRTPLEDYVIRDSGAQDRLLEAIPFMTTAELRQILGALGGTDMKLAGELGNLWSRVVDAMRPDQVFELVANPTIADLGLFRISVASGGLANIFVPRANALKARVEAELGRGFGHDWAGLARAHRQHRRDQLTAAERDTFGAADDSALAAINALKESNPQDLITTEQMLVLIRDAAGDRDGQAAGIEFDDLTAFINDNRERLSPGALAAWHAYADTAEAQAGSGIPAHVWDAMIASIEELAAVHAEEDAALTAAPPEAEEGDGTVEPDLLIGDVDVDPSDGSIDDVILNSAGPPYLVASGEKITTVAELETAIKNLEEKLSTVGDDAQLANVDLQNMLQKQQQLIQMLSNIAKVLHDTAMAVIRKMAA